MRKTGAPTARAPRTIPSRAVLVAVAVLVLGALLAGLAAGALDQRQRSRAEDDFEEGAGQTGQVVQAELRRYFDELRDVGAFLASGPPPTPSEFHAYIEGSRIFRQLDALVGLLVLQRVEPDDLDEFVAEMQEVIPGFRATVLGPLPEGAPHYFVTYDEPGELGLSIPAGIDAGVIENVRTELEAQGDSGEAVASVIVADESMVELAESVELVRVLLDQIDVLIAVPVLPPGQEPDRGVLPSAWVVAPIGQVDDVLLAAFTGLPEDLGMRLTLDVNGNETDGGGEVAERPAAPGPLGDADFHRTEDFMLRGVDWTLTVWSGPDAATEDRDTVAVVLVTGLLASALAAAVAFARIRSEERDIAFAQLEAEHERSVFRSDILDSVSEAVVVLDDERRIVAGNRAWEQLRGSWQSPEESDAGRAYIEVADLSDVAQERVDRAFDDVLADRREAVEIDVQVEGAGPREWSGVRITALHGDPGGLVVVHRDITQRKRSEEELAERARLDPLTGLLNRSAFDVAADQTLEGARRDHLAVASLFIDLDDFKSVNDTWDHTVGDGVLRAVAERVAGGVRATDVVGRHGGDEFVVLLGPIERETGSVDSVTASATAVAVGTAKRILWSLEPPLRVSGSEVSVRASIGVVVAADLEGCTVADLVRRADRAMYLSKQRGGFTYTLADEPSSEVS